MYLSDNVVLFDDYRVNSVLKQDDTFTTYLGTRISNGAPVYIRMLDQSRYTRFDVDKICFSNEIPTLKTFDHKNILRLLAAGTVSNTVCVIYESMELKALDNYLTDRQILDTPVAVDFIHQLAEAIKYSQERGIIHRNIKPGTVGVCEDGKTLKLFDFALSYVTDFSDIPSSRVDSEFGFMAPEVAGLLNRKTDSRSDLYSLGVLFYRFVSGTYPFHAGSIDSMVYQHVAVVPRDPSKINPSVPAELSRIILKLLAKDPDQRYQSASNLIFDLDMFSASESNGRKIGTGDVISNLDNNARIFSCKHELAGLRQSYTMAFEGKGSFCLVTGAKGCGKSDLLSILENELKASNITYYRAHYTVQTVGTPYYGFHEILKKYIDDYNGSFRKRKGERKIRLSADVVRHSDLVINIFPESADIFSDYIKAGETGESARLEPYKEYQRSLSILAEFFLSLTPGNPYVLIFDDIHYIDDASIMLLTEMLNEASDHKVFVVCSCRNGLQDGSSLLSSFIEAFSPDHQPLLVDMKPFGRERMLEYVCDLLLVNPNQCEDLLDYLMEITAGNPYFAANAIRQLLEDSIISINENGLNVDLNRLRVTAGKNEDIFKIINRRIERLPAKGLEVLKQAAVIGDAFDIGLLGKVTGFSAKELESLIGKALELQFINCSSSENGYEFAHRDIHTSFLKMNSEEEMKSIHLRIAKALEEQEGTAAKDVYRLVYHYTEAGSDENVYRYILEAAALAKHSYATNEALAYYDQALRLISIYGREGSEDWCIVMDSLVDLNLALGDSIHAIELAQELLKYIPDQLTSAKLYTRVGTAYYRLSEFEKAEELYIKALRRMGKRFSRRISSSRLINTISYGLTRLDSWSISHNQRVSGKRRDEAATRLVAAVYEALCWSYVYSDINAFKGTILSMVRYVTRELGNSPEYGLSLAGMSVYYTLVGNDRKADECQILAMQQARDVNDAYSIAKICLLTGIEHQWRSDAYRSIKALKEAAERFSNIGDMWQYNNSNVYLCRAYMQSGEYDTAIELASKCEKTSERLNDDFLLALSYANTIACYNEKGSYAEASSFVGKCETIADRLNNDYISVVFCYEAGRLKLEEEKFDDAISYFERGRALMDENKVVSRYYIPLYSYLIIAMVKKLDKERNDLESPEVLNQAAAIGNLMNKLESKNLGRPGSRVIFSRAQALYGILTGRYKIAEKAYVNGNSNTSTSQYHYENAMIHYEYSQYLLSKHRIVEARFHVFEAYMIFSHIGSMVRMKECERIISERYKDAFSESTLLSGVMERHNKMNSDRRINTLLRLGAVLTSTLNDVDLQRQLLQEAVELVGAERGILFLYPESGEKKLYVASVYNLGSFDSNTYEWMLEEVVRSRKPIVINDLQSDEYRKHYPVMARYGIKSVMAMPMILRGDLFGIIYLDSRLVRQIFSEEYIEAMDFIAKQGASPIQNARLYKRAITDGLTGVFGRSYLDNQIIDKTERSDTELAAIMIDVDNFKRCNDTYGHPFGDKVLKNIANIMKRIVGELGIVCRYGGEEFVVLLNTDKRDTVTGIAELIRQTVEKSPVVYTPTQSVSVTISLGVSLWDSSYERVDLIEHADKALYYAKNHGKNQYVVYSPDIDVE